MKNSIHDQVGLAAERAENWLRGYAQGFAQGRLVGARRILFCIGRKKFGGPPTELQQETLNAIDDLPRLGFLAERVLDTDTWAALLAGA